MGLKTFRPRSPGRRGMSGSDFREITRNRPEKSLTAPLGKKSARNNYGRITIRPQGRRPQEEIPFGGFSPEESGCARPGGGH